MPVKQGMYAKAPLIAPEPSRLSYISIANYTAFRRCAGPCDKLVRVPVGLLRSKSWTCPDCEYAAKVAFNWRIHRQEPHQKKHNYDLRPSGYPWSKCYAY